MGSPVPGVDPVAPGPLFDHPPLPRRPVRPALTIRHVALFVLTVVSTTLVGIDHYASYAVGFSGQPFTPTGWESVFAGLTYSVPILLILGTHELGHFYACRYYDVDASAPYFLPMPLVLTGTLGAFIRIREPISYKRALFDIGIAGPIAGFLVAVPMLVLGMSLSRVEVLPEQFNGVVFELGEPLLFKAATWLRFGTVPEGSTVTMHPIAFAAWFGLIATSLNLFPIAQLDGGHISYAVLRRHSTTVTYLATACLVLMATVSTSWLAWAVLTVAMLGLFGARHPRVLDEEAPLDRTRMWLAAFAVLMLVLCFTPAPIELSDLVVGR